MPSSSKCMDDNKGRERLIRRVLLCLRRASGAGWGVAGVRAGPLGQPLEQRLGVGQLAGVLCLYHVRVVHGVIPRPRKFSPGLLLRSLLWMRPAATWSSATRCQCRRASAFVRLASTYAGESHNSSNTRSKRVAVVGDSVVRLLSIGSSASCANSCSAAGVRPRRLSYYP